MRTLLVLTLCFTTSALAIAPGSTLYIRSKDTLLLKEPKPKAATLLKLEQWTAVVWRGPSEKDRRFHEVEVAGKKGFVLLSQLTPNQPQTEIDSASGRPMSNQAFVNSGAAVKDGDWGRAPAHRGNAADEAAAAELIYVEELNKAKATPEALNAKDKELRGP